MLVYRYIIANLMLGVWLIIDAYRCFILSTPTATGLMDAVLSVTLAFLAIKVFTRRPPVAVSAGLRTWIIVLLGTFLPLLYFWLPAPLYFDGIWALVLRWTGTIGFAVSAFQLSDNFSLLPNLRKLVTSGGYRLIRHPMYASYLVLDLANWLPGGSPIAGVVWVAEAFFLHSRALIEEDCLKSVNTEYSAYCERVRYRYIPGII